MKEFLDVYRLFAKNYVDTLFEDGWGEEDTELLKKKLDAVGSLIENGDIVIRVLKREIDDSFDCPYFNITLGHVVKAVFEIEAEVDKKEMIEKSLEDVAVEKRVETHWTGDEDEIIIKYYPEMTASAIRLEKLPHRSEQAIYDRARLLRIQKLKHRKKKIAEPLFDKKYLLKRYGNASVWKPVADFILDNVSGEFTRKDVAELVSKGYKTVLKKEIKPSSANTYAGCYVRYMDSDSSPLLIERCDDPNISPVVLYRKIKPEVTEKPPKEILPEPSKEEEKPVELSKAAKDIYDLAKEKKWAGSGIQINVETIGECLKDYSSDEIKSGLAELMMVKPYLAWQRNPSKVKFK